jgi:hypothetical protein
MNLKASLEFNTNDALEFDALSTLAVSGYSAVTYTLDDIRSILEKRSY